MATFDSCITELGKHSAIAQMANLRDKDFVIPENARSLVLSSYVASGGRSPVLVVTTTEEQSQQTVKDLSKFLPELDISWFPAWETLPFERVSPAIETMGRRSEVLWKIRNGDPPEIIVATSRSISQILAPNQFAGPIVLNPGETVNYETLISQLSQYGYQRTSQVERRGEYAVRGSIIDVYPSTSSTPIRLDVWGDEIERLTDFSVADQRSREAKKTVEIFPARELIPTELVREEAKKLIDTQTWGITHWQRFVNLEIFEGMESWLPWVTPTQETFVDIFPSNGVIFLFEPQRIFQRGEDLISEEANVAAALAQTWGIETDESFPKLHIDLEAILFKGSHIRINFVTSSPDPDTPHISTKSIQDLNKSPEQHLIELLNEDFCVIVTTHSEIAASQLKARIDSIDLNAEIVLKNEDIITDKGIKIISTSDQSGVILPDNKIAIIPETELYGRRRSHKTPKKKSTIPLPQIENLRKGSFVVHEHHGIAQYQGIVKRTLVGNERDYLLLEYRRGDKLYVPTDQIQQVSQYTGGSIPSLSRMGGSDWTRTKTTIRKEIQKIAQELVVLYQERESLQGFRYSPDSLWQKELEESFPFQETPDQLIAMNDVKSDMEEGKPMDRLVCGDVGFGKTEIALRAAFKAVLDNKQVAVLVPTTLLAQQHFQTFTERLSRFPIRIAVLSRFLSVKQSSEVVAKISKGEIDLVIGTHRLLSEDVRFHDLGLLVIDEEQRFGVSHKERIKSMKTNVDVLTLTATPIPRTLEMSLTGIRDLTLLNTPPTDRQPILTYVGDYDDAIVVAAIRREQLRDGQIFFVHNRVSDIEIVADRLREKIPKARIAVAHGQMDEGSLEQTVIDFWEKKYDVLVCTTIIESGIDMPAVNTLIVDRADRLGLGQLHQLRGRVGRSGTKAYAYLLTPPDHNLGEEAYERLRTIGEATDLGSGFRIAMRDLEIRGAGNLLGTGQSGHIAAVGYDLYCKLVTEAVDELRGIPKEEKPEILIELPETAYIPKDYMPREESRLEAYRRLSSVSNKDDVKEIQASWLDRYGQPPEVATNLLRIAYLRTSLRQHGITEIQASKVHGFGKPKWNIRISPISLRPSERVRTLRIYESSTYKEDQKELVLRIPDIAEAVNEIMSFLEGVGSKR
ncbi:MAG: transcription-repair coupling factor [Acidimicrobiales bacterium]|nr:transcription-repair coupling factor [Acidimicrobiales bacterium]